VLPVVGPRPTKPTGPYRDHRGCHRFSASRMRQAACLRHWPTGGCVVFGQRGTGSRGAAFWRNPISSQCREGGALVRL